MKRIFLTNILIFILLATFYILHSTPVAYAQDCTSPSGSDNLLALSEKIASCQRAWDLMEQAKKPHQDELRKMESDIASFQKRIKQIENELVVKEKEIKEGETDLDFQQNLLAKRVRQFYIKSYYNNFLVLIFSQKSAAQILRELAYQQAVTGEDKKVISDIVIYIKDLETNKADLQSERNMLANLKVETDKRAESVRKLLADANAYQQQLSVSLSALTAAQQNILTAKAEVFQTSVGEVPLADDPASSPNYNPGFSPAFAAFSFGAPHRKGMSQYGAWGRAKSGQSAEDILHGYYGGIEIKKDYSTSININVQGYGSYNIEDYVKRIYEMPSSWTDNDSAALKAQAVAARSYALAYTNNGSGSICATESCQVFQSGEKGGAWNAAVDATRGWVLVNNGQPFSAWYAASSGGYNFSYSSVGFTTSGGWDTKCGNRTCWTNDAYEKIAGSPWFYKAWYKERGGATCGRSHPWLTQDEFADIINAWVVFTRGSDEDRNHVTPTDTGCWGGDPYSMDKMKQRANDLGSAFTSIPSLSVDYSADGSTNSVKIGDTSISGSDFKTIFNLRAPGKISLKTSLFNIEKK
ncbi:MAG: SpoIID/LytB domain-containing protein [Candidatus Gottesmanbacteria bacterium]